MWRKDHSGTGIKAGENDKVAMDEILSFKLFGRYQGAVTIGERNLDGLDLLPLAISNERQNDG